MSQFQTSKSRGTFGDYWKGAQSAKFTGGRFHQNHPLDQLDKFVSSGNSVQLGNSGKKTFAEKYTNIQNSQTRTHLKTFQMKYKRSTVFDQQNLTKLIKVPFQSDTNMKTNLQLQNKYNYATIGTSKIKALQNGQKKHGIYRNFYNSQLKSLETIRPFS